MTGLIGNACSFISSSSACVTDGVGTPFSYSKALLNNKTIVAEGTFLVIMGIAAIYLFAKKRNQRPKAQAQELDIKWKGADTEGLLKVSIPETLEMSTRIFNVCLLFDIVLDPKSDQEELFREELQDTIKWAAIRLYRTQRDSMIAVEFCEKSFSSGEPCKVSTTKASLLEKVEECPFDGKGSIMDGIMRSVKQLREMSTKNPQGKNVIILLSNGKRNVEILNKMAKCFNESIYVIGIGNSPNVRILENIVGKANYVEAIDGGKISKSTYLIWTSYSRPIVQAIYEICSRMLPIFSRFNFEFRKVESHFQIRSKYKPNCLTGKKRKNKFLFKLNNPIDNNKAQIVFTYQDPKGLPRKIVIPWNSNRVPQSWNLGEVLPKNYKVMIHNGRLSHRQEVVRLCRETPLQNPSFRRDKRGDCPF